MMINHHFLICLFLVVGAYADLPDFVPKEFHDWIFSMRAKCIKETGVTEADIDSYVISNNAQPIMCYMKCMMLESKWMTSNHQVNYDVIENVVQGELQKILIAALDKCRNFPDGKDPCETAYNFNVCMQQADPVHYFLP
ncbi:pheromone-binding protein-related protein 6-like [Onthophagus taurus]|uniref:pheromone-binding protein-related protein 6-like n=1 Tax=Onthophagus taurus TaxID=166361 RepID=UPI000C203D9E|nr:uncharacterized protein LOC111415591 [Onthophagus taurus]